MPTNNKTENLGLNSWIETDKPKREDFVNDNTILDSIISSHLNDTSVHMSEDDRSKLTSFYEIGTITGNGNATKTYTFSFEPKFVIICLKNYSPFKYDSVNNYTICSLGMAFNNGGYSLGLSLSGAKLTLNQSSSATNGIFTNLNSYLGQYLYVAFK